MPKKQKIQHTNIWICLNKEGMERVDKKWFIDDLDVSQAFPAPIPSNLTAKDLEKRLEPLAKKTF